MANRYDYDDRDEGQMLYNQEERFCPYCKSPYIEDLGYGRIQCLERNGVFGLDELWNV